MKFCIIDPQKEAFVVIDAKGLLAAQFLAGLNRDEVDHGNIGRSLGIVVYEYGLFDPPNTQHFFSIGRRLFAGSAVIYQYDENGETVGYDSVVQPVFYPDVEAVEAAIKSGKISRPMMSVDGKVCWQWPSGMPSDRGWRWRWRWV